MTCSSSSAYTRRPALEVQSLPLWLAFRNGFQPIELIEQLRRFDSFFLAGLGGGWRLQVLIVRQNIPAKLRRHPGELMVRQLSQQLRVGFVGSFVLAGDVWSADIEILV